VSGGGALARSHSGDILSVTLDRPYATDEVFSIDITYHGSPSATAGAFEFTSYGGEDMIWSLSEPFGARTWWPCKDYSDDKPDSADIWNLDHGSGPSDCGLERHLARNGG